MIRIPSGLHQRLMRGMARFGYSISAVPTAALSPSIASQTGVNGYVLAPAPSCARTSPCPLRLLRRHGLHHVREGVLARCSGQQRRALRQARLTKPAPSIQACAHAATTTAAAGAWASWRHRAGQQPWRNPDETAAGESCSTWWRRSRRRHGHGHWASATGSSPGARETAAHASRRCAQRRHGQRRCGRQEAHKRVGAAVAAKALPAAAPAATASAAGIRHGHGLTVGVVGSSSSATVW